MQKIFHLEQARGYLSEPWGIACKGYISDPLAWCKDTALYRPLANEKALAGRAFSIFGCCLFFSCVLPAVAELVSVFETISFLASEAVHRTPETNR